MPNFFQMMGMFNQFKANPGAFLMSRGFNIPQEYMSSPEAAARYLMQTRGMDQNSVNNIMQTAGQFQGFMNNQNQGNNGGNNNAEPYGSYK